MKNRITSRSFSDRMLTIIAYTFVGIFSLVCLYPLLLTLMVSVSDEHLVQIHGFKLIPEKFSLDTFKYILTRASRNILHSYAITIIVTAAGTIFSMMVSSMMAYTLSQKNIKYRNALSLFAYFTVIFSAGMVPWYIICVKVGMVNNIFGLFIPYAINVWNLFLLRNAFQSVPDAVIESARIDGANSFTIFYRLVLPLSKTALLTVGLFYMIQFWNDWWLPIMLMNDDKLYTLQYYLYNLLTSAQALSQMPSLDTGSISLPTETIKMATTIITIGPIIFLYPIVQKYFVKGITVGAVKG